MSTSENIVHIPVLLNEILFLFEGLILENFIDGTTGLGGHAKALLEAHPEINKYLAIDQDIEALAIAKKTLDPWKNKVIFENRNFSEFKEAASFWECRPQGILMDLGVSSLQFDSGQRGFSFRFNAPLDMRMDKENPLTAEEIINTWPIDKIEKILYELGEERRAKRIAERLKEARKKTIIRTTDDLMEVLSPVVGRPSGKKHLHPLTLVYQALRLAVNRELEVLKEGLDAAFHLLTPGGRLAVISFHRLEDRIVKEYFREKSKEGSGLLVVKKPLVPTRGEIIKNRRSRSAKLRCIEKV